MSKSIVIALAGALAMGVLAAPAAEAKGKHNNHHRFFVKPYVFQSYDPICGKWVWSHRRDRFVCVWWY